MYVTATIFEDEKLTISMISPAETEISVVPDVSEVPPYADEV